MQAVVAGASLLVPAVWVLANSMSGGAPVRGRARSYKINLRQPGSGCRIIGCRSQLACARCLGAGEFNVRGRSGSRASPLLQDQLAPAGIGISAYWLQEPACLCPLFGCWRTVSCAVFTCSRAYPKCGHKSPLLQNTALAISYPVPFLVVICSLKPASATPSCCQLTVSCL